MIYSIVIGGLAGWLAGKIMKGGGYGVFKNILLGIIGGLVGNWIFDFLGINILNNTFGDILEGVIGAIVILAIAGAIKKK